MEYCLNSFKTHLNGKQIVARKLEAILTPLPQNPPPLKTRTGSTTATINPHLNSNKT